MRLSDLWKGSDKVQRLLLFSIITFLIFTRILTWFAIKYLGLRESSLGTLGYILSYGVTFGLVLNTITVILFIFLGWIAWAFYREKIRNYNFKQFSHTTVYVAFTLFFFFLFWFTAIDLLHDEAMVLFRSKVFQPFLNYWYPSSFAIISAIPYLWHVNKR